VIIASAYPRAALVGNPSDGYYGKTIAFVFRNFKADVVLEKSAQIRLLLGSRDRLMYSGMEDLADDIRQYGYYGGIRLMKATIKKFHDYCRTQRLNLHQKKFSIGYSSDIPIRLGLAGSSAIVTAAMKALMQFYEIEIPKPLLANLVLAVEKDELKMGAGLQDRVAQAYECPVFMNFDKRLMELQGYGEYIPFDKKLLPPIYIAYRTHLSEGSELTHNDLAERYARKDPAVLEAVAQWTQLTEQVWNKLQRGDKNIGELLNQNFDIRRKLIPISKGNIEMIEAARSVGASAKFTGSGGAIIGTYEDEKMFDVLVNVMKKTGAAVIKPVIG